VPQTICTREENSMPMNKPHVGFHRLDLEQGRAPIPLHRSSITTERRSIYCRAISRLATTPRARVASCLRPLPTRAVHPAFSTARSSPNTAACYSKSTRMTKALS